jgi:predicted PurR-regulated permease PerM
MQPDPEFERRASSSLPDLLIRAGLIGALAVLCYRAIAPFLTLIVWSIILAITMYPLHQWLARRIGGRQGLASTILVILAVLLIVIPTPFVISSTPCSKTSWKYPPRQRGWKNGR